MISYLLLCAIAALMPFIKMPERKSFVPCDFAGWPAEFEGRALQPVPLAERDRRFAEGFPGRVAAFTDGHRQILMRWIASPTRKLHPAVDCFRGSGYTVRDQRLRRNDQGRAWGVFTATKDGLALTVSEQIHDDLGQTWSDVSAWYWSAFSSAGPWWSVTIVESE